MTAGTTSTGAPRSVAANEVTDGGTAAGARVSWLAALLLALAPLWLAANLRPDAFYVGDSGVKLIAARAALANPGHPLNVALPQAAAMTVPNVEPFFLVHGDHAHAITSPLFPLVSAPLLAAFGLRGLYVLPSLSFVVTLAGCVVFSRAIGLGRDGAMAAVMAAVGTPFLFYGLEFWEHLPAVAAAASAAALLARGYGAAAGGGLGVAILLRPEAACFSAALLLSRRWLGGLAAQPRLVFIAAGALAVLLPYEAYVVRHFGGLVPPHVGTNAEAAAGQPWLNLHLAVAGTWFGSLGKDSLWVTAPVSAGAIVAFAATPRRYLGVALLGGLTLLLTVMTMPNAGGGQWGPRYLLPAQIAFVVITADALERLRPWRLRALAIGLALVAGVSLQRAAYRELRGTKSTYGATIDVLAAAVAGRPVVTDVWWLDQVAASLFGARPALFAAQDSTGRDLVQVLSDSTVPAIALVRPSDREDANLWFADSCYFVERQTTSPAGDLAIILLRHRCRQ